MLTILLFPLAFLLTLTHAYANPGACTGDCNVHDLSVLQRSSDGKYYRFSTGNRITIASAPSLTGPWTNRGAAIPSGSSIDLPGAEDLWAPSVHKVGTSYILYYSVSEFGSQTSAIGYATSTSLDAGTWTDHGRTGIASSPAKPYNAIDAALLTTSSGEQYLSFGSFWAGLYQVRMNAGATAPAGAPSYQIAYNATGSHSVEGAYMFAYGGYYYLTFSSGVCCGYDAGRPAKGEEYKIMVCRSASATGGFVDKSGKACKASGGSVLLQSHDKVYGPGGQGVFTDSSQGLVLYYHYVDTSVGYADGQKRFGWNKLSWSGGWPVV
ncbi:putative arabinan endo-1,5-alpha-L-arabinosidase A [Pseudovirgaria hyperparasitica]|uniref:Arabinan endo-1,5-alpha-L-arabinosidase n=1 Tax=Pseudovirgaria hyperparasitica TaxID=470096 RepID=A0A6A6VS33_9PEZI|nr:putative arabinan endo-1,5-alpha-L-arabinosidase A [Pseudovirgaria hyperparasitica]KAF2753013.1 putative arabinan endo-1,5-alpha-L-arabinosidase A [Pseudovirgaria hyperparasitica]